MWLLTFFPSILIHLILALGIILMIGTLLVNVFPVLKPYTLPAQIVACLLMAIGFYLEGGLAYKNKIAVEVAQLEKRLAEAKAESEKKNTEIQTNVVKEIQVVKEKGDVITKYVTDNSAKIDENCKVPADVVDAHNTAVKIANGQQPTPTNTKNLNDMILPPRVK